MKFKLFLIALTLMAMQSICSAQQFEKNGLPCVAEICLGDGIAELSKVHWDRVNIPHKSQSAVNAVYHGDTKQAAPFLSRYVFDSSALVPLSRVIAVCLLDRSLDGTYTTKNGNPTRVSINLIPNISDTTKQQWIVTSINRSYPTAVSKEQQDEVATQLSERYKAFDKGNLYIPKLGEGTYKKSLFNVGFSLNLFTGSPMDKDTSNQLKLHPACGGAAKVKID